MYSHSHSVKSNSAKLSANFFSFLFPALTLLIATASIQAATLNVPSAQFATVQAAVNAANPGDTIVLQAGKTFVEKVNLKYKPGSEYITIQSSAMQMLPPDGYRVNPSFAAQMPRIVPDGYGEPAFYTEITAAGASHHYKLVGLEIAQADPNQLGYNLVAFGSGDRDQTDLAQVAHDFVVDRCYIHGHENGEVRRGIGLNSLRTKIVNSYISEIHQWGYDTQAIAGWNGPGEYQIINNYLEAAGENIMFGGADPWIKNLVPSDIEIRHNHITKPMAWRDRERRWTVKNLLEIKNAKRLTIDRNLFENNWGFAFGAAQNGCAIVLSVRNQDNTAPWSTIEDVKITNNIVRRVGSGIGVLGTDDTYVSQTMKNLTVHNNLFEDLGGNPEIGGNGTLFGFSNTRDYSSGVQNVTLTNNTAFHTGMFIAGEEFARLQNLRVENNVNKEHILKGDVAGTAAFERLAGSAWTFRNNAFTIENYCGYWKYYYPSDAAHPNFYLCSYDSVGFVDRARGNYRLAPSSPFRNKGADGKDVGVDYKGLNAALTTSDFDSDGKTDAFTWRAANGTWYVLTSANNKVRQFQFGQSGDVPVAADYDGDGQTDYAVFRPANGTWYIMQSSTSRVKAVQFGQPGDVPVAADYDADGKADPAVYRTGAAANTNNLFVLNSSTNAASVKQWGTTNDKFVVGDFDGDGKSDAAVFRPGNGTWYINASFDNAVRTINFGTAGDVPAAGDYDGDGRLDIAVWRAATGIWLILRSDSSCQEMQFGANGDVVMPGGDFDGDGKSDAAVYRPNNGTWYLMRSQAGFKMLSLQRKQLQIAGKVVTVR